MAGTVSGRRYTTKELDAMEQQETPESPESPTALPFNAVDPAVALGRSLSPDSLADIYEGAKNSVKRTGLGLKQIGAYAFGGDEGRERINEEIRQLEANAPDSPSAKAGEVLGTMGQFLIPGMIAQKVGQTMPAVSKAIQTVTGLPGSLRRGAITAGTYEALQPVQPGDLSNEAFILPKAGRTAIGAGAGAVAAKVGNVLTNPGPTIAPERRAIAKEANRLGIQLTPAQRTGDKTLQQYEEGLLAKPGSGKVIADVREAQRQVLDKKAAQAIGTPFSAPHEAALSFAGDNARRGYEPLATIPKMSPDLKYFDSLDKFIAKQATKATGSTDAAAIAMRLKKGSGKATGDTFLEELQGVRDLAYDAVKNGDSATAKQLRDLSNIMEDFAERRVTVLAKQGKVVPDAVDMMRNARTEFAKIHAVEKATEPVTGRVSALKYLNQEFKRRPSSAGAGVSPVNQGLRDVGATARVLKQTQPYIGSSGTAERLAGQQLVDASTGTLGAIRAAGPMAKNYLAAKYYLARGGQPGILGSRLSPSQNALVRRLLPPMTIAAGEALD